MKTAILVALAILSLAVGVANADPAGRAASQQDGNQYIWTAGAPGWG